MSKYNISYYENGEKITRVTADSLKEAIFLKEECDKTWKVYHFIESVKRIRKKLIISIIR